MIKPSKAFGGGWIKALFSGIISIGFFLTRASCSPAGFSIAFGSTGVAVGAGNAAFVSGAVFSGRIVSATGAGGSSFIAGIGSGNFATIVGAATISGAFISTTRFGSDLFSTGFDGMANPVAFCGSLIGFRSASFRFVSGDGFGVASLISSGSGFSALSFSGAGGAFAGVSTIDGNATGSGLALGISTGFSATIGAGANATGAGDTWGSGDGGSGFNSDTGVTVRAVSAAASCAIFSAPTLSLGGTPFSPELLDMPFAGEFVGLFFGAAGGVALTSALVSDGLGFAARRGSTSLAAVSFFSLSAF